LELVIIAVPEESDKGKAGGGASNMCEVSTGPMVRTFELAMIACGRFCVMNGSRTHPAWDAIYAPPRSIELARTATLPTAEARLMPGSINLLRCIVKGFLLRAPR